MPQILRLCHLKTCCGHCGESCAREYIDDAEMLPVNPWKCCPQCCRRHLQKPLVESCKSMSAVVQDQAWNHRCQQPRLVGLFTILSEVDVWASLLPSPAARHRRMRLSFLYLMLLCENSPFLTILWRAKNYLFDAFITIWPPILVNAKALVERKISDQPWRLRDTITILNHIFKFL